jgi:hypothetical protein
MVASSTTMSWAVKITKRNTEGWLRHALVGRSVLGRSVVDRSVLGRLIGGLRPVIGRCTSGRLPAGRNGRRVEEEGN